MIEFRIGERIKYVSARNPKVTGMVGTVVGWIDHANVGRCYRIKIEWHYEALWPWNEVQPEFMN